MVEYTPEIKRLIRGALGMGLVLGTLFGICIMFAIDNLGLLK